MLKMFKTKATSKRLLKRGFSAEEINSINVSEFKTIDEAVEHLLASKDKNVIKLLLIWWKILQMIW